MNKYISITDKATPILKALPVTLKGPRLRKQIGTAEKVLFQRNFLAKGTNKRGWPSTGFYAGAARSTNFQVVTDGVVISVSQQGIRQRLYGGPINAKPGKALTIPISPVSYGHVASEFPGLFLLKIKGGNAYLVQSGTKITSAGKEVQGTKLKGNSKRRLKAGLNFLFVLKKTVTQQADPTVIPSDAEITGTALDAIRAAAERAMQPKGGGQ